MRVSYAASGKVGLVSVHLCDSGHRVSPTSPSLLGACMYRTRSYQVLSSRCWYRAREHVDPRGSRLEYVTEGLLMKLLQKNQKCTWSQDTYVSILMYQGYIPPPKKNRRPIKNNNLNTELKEMGVFSAVEGNQFPNQLQKRGLPALFHLRCPSQSHQRSARGRTRLTTVTSISCRSF